MNRLLNKPGSDSLETAFCGEAKGGRKDRFPKWAISAKGRSRAFLSALFLMPHTFAPQSDWSANWQGLLLHQVPLRDYNLLMRIVAVSYLRAFWESNPDAEQQLKSWVDEAKKATWNQPAEIKAQYRNASILKDRRVVFNLKGNDYRLVLSVAYRYQAVYVKFIGTHAEYDLIDAETVEVEG